MKRAAVLFATAVGLVGALMWIQPEIPDPPKLPGRHLEGFIQIDSLVRRYETYVPAHLGAAPPLLLAFHGSGMDATALREWTFWRFDELAEEEGFVLVYPEGHTKE